MDRTSFYGGPNGQSFQIRQIFKTKKEMIADLSLRWQSSIGIGDFVVISYGLPNDYDYYYVRGGKKNYIEKSDVSIDGSGMYYMVSGVRYEVHEVTAFSERQQTDADEFDGLSYNSTLWQKIYTENDKAQIDALTGIETEYIHGNYGVGYKLIASMTGNTPRLTAFYKVIHSYETPHMRVFNYYDPSVPESQSAGLDRIVIVIYLPMSQIVTFQKITTLKAEDAPIVTWDTTTNGTGSTVDSNGNAVPNGRDRPILKIGIPPGWEWDLDYSTIPAKDEPTVTMDDDGSTQTLHIRLPRTWKWALSHTKLKAEDDPVVQLLTNNSTDTKTLKIDLPSPWAWALDYATIAADQNPTVDLSDDGNTQTLEMRLPRTWKWVLATSLLDAIKQPVIDLLSNPATDTKTLQIDIPKPWLWALDYDTLTADQSPTVTLDHDDNTQTIKVRLPQTWSWVLSHAVLDAQDDPYVEVIDDATNNQKTLQIDLPAPWQWELDYALSDANVDPTMVLTNDPNVQTLTVTLPKAWVWDLKGQNDKNSGKYNILDCDQPPLVELTDDGNTQYLEFSLPQAQVMQDPTTVVVDPSVDPTVSLSLKDSDINKPYLEFTLPRSARFFYGGLLGQRSVGTYTSNASSVSACRKGDYYVNQATGFIYEVLSNVSGVVTFKYVACLQAPFPQVEVAPLKPYNSDGSQKTPATVTSSFVDDVEKTGWKLTFNLPELPNFSVEPEFIGPDETGSATLTPDSEDNITLNVKIPRGSKVFAGDEVTAADQGDMLSNPIADALPGDIFINTKTGKVYKLDSSKSVWVFQSDGLRGPAGEPLHHKKTYTIQQDASGSPQDTLDNGADVIDNDSTITYPITSDMVFTVIWRNDQNEETAYWYYKTDDGDWARAKVTSGASVLIQNEWLDSPDTDPVTDKTYSVDYINKLIGGNITDDNKDTTAFSKDQIYALFSWGTFAEANSGQWWPDPGQDHNALSASEVLQLASWGGDIASLITI